MEGYIKLYRKLLGSDVASKGADLLGLFVLLLLRAAWKPMHHEGQRLERGQCAFTLSELARESKLTQRQTRLRLKALSDMGTILTNQRANRYHVVTLVNWALYQDMEERKGSPKGRQRADQGQTDLEKVNNGSPLDPSKKARITSSSKKGGAPVAPSPLCEILGEYRKRFREAHGTNPAGDAMEALGKSARLWIEERFTQAEILGAVTAFFSEAWRQDHDPKHFAKFFRNGYSGLIVAARKEAETYGASNMARDLETIREARERWQGSPEERAAKPDSYLRNYMGRLWTEKPYPPKLGAALSDLARLLGVEAPC